MAGYAFNQVLRLGSNLIMTRLLAPDLFGIMAMVGVIMHGLHLFSDVGLRQQVIQSGRSDDPAFINTIWSVQIARGIVIWVFALGFALVFALAASQGWVSAGTVYGHPELPAAVIVMSISAVIAGFESTKLAISARHLAQGQLVAIETASQLVAIAVMVVWALVEKNIWALVAGGLTGSLVRTLLSHVSIPGQGNRWHWSPDALRDIVRFGKWIFLSSILGFLLINGDRLLLGGLISTEVFGVYSIAFLIVNSVQAAISRLSDSVVFPTLSEVARDRPGELRSTYYKFRMKLDPVALFLSGFLITGGAALIDALYDARYAHAGDMLRILAFALIAHRYSLADQCYLAMGRPRLLAILIAVRVAALYLSIPIGFMLYGFKGALWGIVFSSFASVPVSLLFAARLGVLDVRRELLVLPVLLPGAALGLLRL